MEAVDRKHLFRWLLKNQSAPMGHPRGRLSRPFGVPCVRTSDASVNVRLAAPAPASDLYGDVPEPINRGPTTAQPNRLEPEALHFHRGGPGPVQSECPGPCGLSFGEVSERNIDEAFEDDAGRG